MAKPSYRELLLDPRWQKVRLKKLEAADWMCQSCYSDSVTLSVHHKRYVKGRQPWEYEDHELTVLCQPCHEAEHEAKDLRSELISHLHADGPAGAWDFHAVAAGYIGQQTNDEGIAAVVGKFYDVAPYQVESGKVLAALHSRFRLTKDDLARLSNALYGLDENELADELVELFAKHGIHERGHKAN